MSKKDCRVRDFTVFESDFIEELKLNPSLNSQVAVIKNYMEDFTTPLHGSLLNFLAMFQYDGATNAGRVSTYRELFDFALRIGVNLDKQCWGAKFCLGTPLHSAISMHNFQAAKKLIDAGADLWPDGESVFLAQNRDPLPSDVKAKEYEKNIKKLQAYVDGKK